MEAQEALSQVCPLIDPKQFLHQKPNTQNESIYNIIEDTLPKRTSVIPVAAWSDSMNIIEFKPILTHDGICFTGNTLNSREIYTDE